VGGFEARHVEGRAVTQKLTAGESDGRSARAVAVSSQNESTAFEHDAIEKTRSEMRAALYSEAACPTETVFFAFRLKATRGFFWGGTSEGSAAELLRISVSARNQFWSASPPFAAQI
jgi:hypothetical protein